jgi:hypothetical protein
MHRKKWPLKLPDPADSRSNTYWTLFSKTPKTATSQDKLGQATDQNGHTQTFYPFLLKALLGKRGSLGWKQKGRERLYA